jgi:TMEM175 potassium channel family protein
MKAKRADKAGAKEGKGPARMLSLSDGLFATVFTVLVLDLRIPEAIRAGAGNESTLVKWLGPHLFSYLLTFLVAGTYWLAHHRNFDLIVDYDRGLLGYNLLFLLFIGLLPFSTAGISSGSYRSTEFAFYWSIYASDLLLAGVMLTLTWTYAVAHNLTAARTTGQETRYITMRQSVTPAVFLISILAEWLLPQAFPGPWTLLLIPLAMWWVDRRYAAIDPDRPSSPASRSDLFWRVGRILPWAVMIGLAIWATTI